MAAYRTTLRDAGGRTVPVVHGRLKGKNGAAEAQPVPTAAVNFRDELDRLTSRVRRLMPFNNDTERFFIERSEIANALAKLAKQIG